jgi:transportin-3
VQYPEDFQHWTGEEYREFKRVRYAIADTLTEAASVVGAMQTLHIVAIPMQKLHKTEATVLSPTNDVPNLDFDWRCFEASLYCVRSISKEPPPAGDPLLLSILASLIDVPEHSQLLYTAALTISAYSEWVSASLDLGTDSVLLQKLLGVLHRALISKNTDTRGAAALALKHICAAAAAHLVTFLDPLVQLHVLAMNSMTVSQGTTPNLSSSMSSDHLEMHADDVIQIIEGLGHVTTALPVGQADPVFSALLAPISVPLSALFPEEPVGAKPDGNVVVKYFDCLAAVMRYVSHPELVATSFHELWPMVSRALISCGNTDVQCTEHICRCIKYAIRTSG